MIRRAALFVLVALAMTASSAVASQTSGTITTGGNEGYAWSSTSGWINFGASQGAIIITDSGITGYAWSTNHGWINMNPDNGGVHVAANGALSGKAWGERLGWIDFAGVSIDSNGRFTGQATGDGIGTLVFGCDHCSVVTDYRPSASRPIVSGGGGSGGPLAGAISPAASTESPAQETSLTQGVAGTGGGTSDQFGFGGGSAITRGLNTLRERVAGPLAALGFGRESTRSRPAQLFDIRLLLDDPSVERIIDLVARVTFENFGSEPTPVEISYEIADTAGQVLWHSSETVTVETELVAVKRFATIVDVPDLPDGPYMLHVHTRYNDTVEDDFSASFSIEPQRGRGWVGLPLAGLAGLLTMLVIIRFVIARRRQAPSALGLETHVS